MTPASCSFARLAPLALVVVLAAACGDNNKSTAAPKTPPTTTAAAVIPTNPAPPSGRGNPAGKGKLLMGKRNILPLVTGRIRRFAPTQVEGKSLKVVALAGPTSFWAGNNRKQRILVTMRLKGGKPPKITVGQKVNFIGLLSVAPANAGALGVRKPADATLLETQGAYVDASAADVKLR